MMKIRATDFEWPRHQLKFKKCHISALFVLFGLILSSPEARADYNPQRSGFSYTYPTQYSDWENAFLAGNGKLGIMVFGNPLNDTVVYNDRGFNMAASTNSPFRSFAQVSASDLATIRSNCAAGNFAAANRLAVRSAHYNGGGEGVRHPGYEMAISISPNGAISNYSRTCNFETGEISVNWHDGLGDWVRKSFVSRQDNVVVQYLPAPSGGTITCSIELTTDPGMNFPSRMTFESLADTNFLNMRVKYSPDAGTAGYEGVTRVVASGGTESVNGDVLTISNANSIILLTRTAKYHSQCEDQWNQRLLQNQLSALPSDYGTLLAGQIATHQAIYDRVKIDLNASASDRELPNETLLDRQRNSTVPVKALWERVFDAGRYYYLHPAVPIRHLTCWACQPAIAMPVGADFTIWMPTPIFRWRRAILAICLRRWRVILRSMRAGRLILKRTPVNCLIAAAWWRQEILREQPPVSWPGSMIIIPTNTQPAKNHGCYIHSGSIT